jgi:hypothetical protein
MRLGWILVGLAVLAALVYVAAQALLVDSIQ